jgi:CBS-domain-containing membrane protein
MKNETGPRFSRFVQKHKKKQLLMDTLGVFLGISLVTYIGLRWDNAILFPSLVSSAIILFASPVSRQKVKVVVGGQLVSALTGVTVYKLLGTAWWSVSIGVALAMFFMVITDTVTPPGGATAFVAVMSKQPYSFVLDPVLLGLGLLVLTSFFVGYVKQSYFIKEEL